MFSLSKNIVCWKREVNKLFRGNYVKFGGLDLLGESFWKVYSEFVLMFSVKTQQQFSNSPAVQQTLPVSSCCLFILPHFPSVLMLLLLDTSPVFLFNSVSSLRLSFIWQGMSYMQQAQPAANGSAEQPRQQVFPSSMFMLIEHRWSWNGSKFYQLETFNRILVGQ